MRYLIHFCWFGLLLMHVTLVSRLGFTQEMDPALVVYLANIERYKAIEFEAKRYVKFDKPVGGRPKLDGLVLVHITNGVHRFTDGSFRFQQRVYVDGFDGLGHWVDRKRSWTDGVSRYAEDPKSALNLLDKSISPGYGTILEQPLEVADSPGTPFSLLGFYVTLGSGQRHHLADLIQKKTPVKKSNTVFVIENMYEWPESFGSAYDLEFKLSAGNGFMPEEITIWDRVLGNPMSTAIIRRKVYKFQEYDGLFFPVDYSLETEKNFGRTTLEIKAVNPVLSPSDFEFEFPPDHPYVDARTGEMLENGKLIRRLEIDKQGNALIGFHAEDKRSGWSPWFIGAAVAVVGAAALLILYRRGRLGVGMVLLILFPGCEVSSGIPTDRSAVAEQGSEKAAKQTETADKQITINEDLSCELTIQNGVERTISVSVGSLPETVVFDVTNSGSCELQFSDQIRTTCGCSFAELESTVLPKGSRTRVTTTIQPSMVPGMQNIAITVPIVAPVQAELMLNVHVNYQGDWVCQDWRLVFSGTVGSESTAQLDLMGKPSVLKTLVIESPDLVKIQELKTASNDRRSFVLSHVINSDTIERGIGFLRISSPNGLPSEHLVSLVEKGGALASWSPKAMLYSLSGPVGQNVELVLSVSDCSLFELRSEVFKANCIQQSGDRMTVELKPRDVPRLGSVNWVEAVVKLGELCSPIKLPVLVVE